MTVTPINQQILNSIIQDDLNNRVFDQDVMYSSIDTNDRQNLIALYKYVVVQKKHMTKREWDYMIHRKTVSEYFDAPYPENPTDYVKIWTNHANLNMTYKGDITSAIFRSETVKSLYTDLNKITKEIDVTTDPKLLRNYKIEHRMLLDKIKSSEQKITLDILFRKIKITRDNLKLKFTDSQINDALDEWVDVYKSTRRGEIFSSIMYINNESEVRKANDDLSLICNSLFDTNYMPAHVSKNIIKKFIWQVKRKAKHESVTNHIMPVFTGPQGVGKSTFIKNLISPIAELSAPTDFKQLTDDRNITMFTNLVLVMDEMGYADRSDMETVKNIMTSDVLSRRPMRQNTTINVTQDATLIGASNKEIEQLIRDETGIRRFIGIRFSKHPDWEAVSNIDWSAIWRSVDEEQDDPTLETSNEIKEIQEASRCKTPCEMWVKTLKQKDEMEKTASNWYSQYKIWEGCHYHKKSMEYDVWTKELRRLIASHIDYPFEFRMDGNKEMFKFTYND